MYCSTFLHFIFAILYYYCTPPPVSRAWAGKRGRSRLYCPCIFNFAWEKKHVQLRELLLWLSLLCTGLSIWHYMALDHFLALLYSSRGEQDRVAGPDCSLHPRRMFPVCPVISSSQVLPPTQMNIKLQNTKVQCIENTIRLKALNQANTVLILVQLNCSIPVTLTDVGVCSPIHQIIWKHRGAVKIWLLKQNS